VGLERSETVSRSAPPRHRPHAKAAQPQRNHDEDRWPEVEEIPDQHPEPRRRDDPAEIRNQAKPRQRTIARPPRPQQVQSSKQKTKRLALSDYRNMMGSFQYA